MELCGAWRRVAPGAQPGRPGILRSPVSLVTLTALSRGEASERGRQAGRLGPHTRTDILTPYCGNGRDSYGMTPFYRGGCWGVRRHTPLPPPLPPQEKLPEHSRPSVA